MEQQLKCLRCGFEYSVKLEPKEVRERVCPRCQSNSVRRIASEQRSS